MFLVKILWKSNICTINFASNFMPSSKFLFVPVSSPKGIGEYIRSLSIAQEISHQYPEAKIHFILSEQSSYFADCPFPTTLCPTSPTFHSATVKQCIDSFKPDVVLFDAAGRSSLLKHCKTLGLTTIFICPRVKKINKSLTLRRLLYTDQIWVAQPAFMVPDLTWWQQVKLNFMKKSHPIITGPIFSKPNQKTTELLQKRYHLRPKKYIVVNSGGGGHRYNGATVSSIFLEAARLLRSCTEYKIVLVHGTNAVEQHNNTLGIIEINQLSPTEFNSLLRGAGAALLAGGSVVLQSLSYKQKVVAAPITDEQKKRISQFENRKLLIKSSLVPEEMAKHLLSLLENERSVETTSVENGIDNAMTEIKKIMRNEKNT